MAEGHRVSTMWRQGESVKPILFSALTGTMWLVHYPYRKTPDLYVAFKDHPVFCARPKCQADEFPVSDWLTHIRGHDRRHGDADIVTLTGDVVDRIYEAPS